MEKLLQKINSKALRRIFAFLLAITLCNVNFIGGVGTADVQAAITYLTDSITYYDGGWTELFLQWQILLC